MARRDPKVGTGKKPKGSGRRLYTDEIQKTLLVLNLLLRLMREKLCQKLKKSKNRLHEKFKS